MDYFKNTISIFQEKITSFLGRDKQKQEVNPYRDWLILVVLFFTLSLLAVWLGFYLFIQMNNGSFFLSEDNVPLSQRTIDKRLLLQIIEDFDIKAKIHQELLETRPIVVDPTL